LPLTSFENDGLTFRRGTDQDIPKILGFVDIYLRKDWLVRRNYLWDTMHNDETWVVFDGKKLVSWATVGRKSRRGLWNLLVHPKYRGRRIGSVLVEALKPDYVRSKADQSTGDPTPFYEKLGYETVQGHAGRKGNINIMRRRKSPSVGPVAIAEVRHRKDRVCREHDAVESDEYVQEPKRNN